MKRFLFVVGFVVLAVPVHAQEKTILEAIEEITLFETMDAGTELDVQTYLPLILKGRLWHPVEEGDVDIAVQQDEKLLCASWDESQGNCFTTKEIAHQARRAAWHRTLARDLQLIVTGHENKMVGWTGQTSPLDAGLPGILNIWQSGVDEMTNPVLSRTPSGRPIDLEDADDEINSVRGALNQLVETKNGKESQRLLAAAVFRYRHGFNYVTRSEGMNCPGADAQNDMEILTMRHCPLESALRGLAALLLKDGEPVLYKSVSLDDLGVVIWIRQDDVGLQWQLPLEPVMPTLESRMAPGTVRLGGTYPDDIPEPALTGGICSHPIGARGYLCRPVEGGNCSQTRGQPLYLAANAKAGEIREDTAGNFWYKQNDGKWHGAPGLPDITRDDQWMDENTKRIVSEPTPPDSDLTITLVECLPYNYRSELPIHVTDSGPDICTTGGWRLSLYDPSATANFADGADLDAQCQTCMPDIECIPSPPDENTPDDKKCFTGDYNANTGRLKVCVNEKSGLPAQYTMMKELVVAQQLCSRSPRESLERKLFENRLAFKEKVEGPVGDPMELVALLDEEKNLLQECCSLQWYPSLVACKAMAEDGNFQDTDTGILECAGAIANQSCGGQCSPPPIMEENETPEEKKRKEDEKIKQEEELIHKIVTSVKSHTGAGEACSAFLEEAAAPEARIESIKSSFPISCSPNCKVQYENTIGNNLCYIGQCVEQAMEGSRLIPGRMTFGSGDEAYPWDGCAAPDPQNGAFIEMPAAHVPYVPLYRGLEMVRAADIAVCQANGYPPLTPPVLCLFSPTRQMVLPYYEASMQVTGMQAQAEEQAIRSYLAQAASASIGVRAATSLYEDFIDRSLGEFGSLIKIAAGLIGQIGETKWPSYMCPRYNEQGCSLFQSQ